MSRNYMLMLLFFLSCSIHAIAQTDYYYYQGNKIPLTLNEDRFCVSIPKDCDEISKRTRANVQVLVTINDETLDIFVISRSDFETLTSLDFWEEDAKSVILTSSYFTEDHEEVFASPYLNVRLKNEQDIDLLTSYAEEYRLRIAGKSAFMPWYILAVTPESEKSPLECANELFESGNFAASVPDLVSIRDWNDQLVIHSITTATKEESSEIFDLQGRQLQDKPDRGLYIQNGRKVVIK